MEAHAKHLPIITYQAELFRKLVHLSSLWMPVCIYKIGTASIPLFIILLAAISLYELLRRHETVKSHIVIRSFNPIIRPHESDPGSRSLTGAFYVVLAALLSVSLFSDLIAATALIIMLVGDMAAALVGRKWGKTKIGSKSAEGVAAFIIASVVAILVFAFFADPSGHYLPIALVGILAGCIAELFAGRLKLDDNIAIVMASATVMHFLANVY